MKKRFLCLALVLVMLVGIIPFSAVTAFAAEEKMQIDTIILNIPSDVGAKRLTADQIRFNDNGNDTYAEYHKRVEIKNNEVTWLKGDKFGEEMGAEETYATGTDYYLKFTLTIKAEYASSTEFDSYVVNRVFGQEGTDNVEAYQQSKTEILITMMVKATVPKVTINIPDPNVDGTMTFADLSNITVVDEEGYYNFHSVSLWYAGNNYRDCSVPANEKEATDVITTGQYCAEIMIIAESDARLHRYNPIEIIGADNYEITYVYTATLSGQSLLTIYITVDTRTPIEELPLTVTEPAAGEAPAAPIAPIGASVIGYDWKTAGGLTLPAGYKFVAGESYTLIARINIDADYEFQAGTPVTINGETVTCNGDDTAFMITYNFTVPGEKQGFEVSGTVTAPVGGATPSHIVINANDYVTLGTGNWTGELVADKFICGKEYTYTFLIYPKAGYNFTVAPVVTVNGQLATIDYYTKDYARCVVTMMSNDHVTATAPKLGDAIATPIVNDPRLTYSSHTWYDKAADSAMGEYSNFSAGKTYTLLVTVTSDTVNLALNSWEFIMINGQRATRSSFALDGKSASYMVDFVEPTVIIENFDILVTPPIEGEAPSATATDPSGRIEISSVTWTPDASTFTQGESYKVTIVINAKDGYAFAVVDILAINDYLASCKINGVGMDKLQNMVGFDTDTTPTTLTLSRTFTCLAAHTHSISSTFNGYDATHHWKECTDPDCPDPLKGRTEYDLHSGGTATCSAAAVCTCGQSYGEKADHVFSEKITDNAHLVSGTGADCMHDKEFYFDCANCDEIGTTTWLSNIKGEHDYGTLVQKVEAIHTSEELKAGKQAYHFCDICDTYFTEEKVATTEADLVIATPTHNYVIANGYKGEDGHANTCYCGAHDTITAHNPDRAEATETEPVKCTVCQYIITPALGHTTCSGGIKQNGQAATCTTDGWNDYYKCSGCNKIYTDAACTPANEITDLDAWKTGAGKTLAAHTPNADDGDCTTEITCSVCGETTTAAKATHTAGADDGDCTTAVKCVDCDKIAIEAKEAHTDENTDGKCDACDKDMPTTPGGDEPKDDEGGLGAGAIVGIVVGSVLVVGIGGFALVWFVIKKKTWAEFLAIFKKG